MLYGGEVTQTSMLSGGSLSPDPPGKSAEHDTLAARRSTHDGRCLPCRASSARISGRSGGIRSGGSLHRPRCVMASGSIGCVSANAVRRQMVRRHAILNEQLNDRDPRARRRQFPVVLVGAAGDRAGCRHGRPPATSRRGSGGISFMMPLTAVADLADLRLSGRGHRRPVDGKSTSLS